MPSSYSPLCYLLLQHIKNFPVSDFWICHSSAWDSICHNLSAYGIFIQLSLKYYPSKKPSWRAPSKQCIPICCSFFLHPSSRHQTPPDIVCCLHSVIEHIFSLICFLSHSPECKLHRGTRFCMLCLLFFPQCLVQFAAQRKWLKNQ